jgi:phosphoglycolate phosphatase
VKYRCVIFDLDGTLADTVSELAAAINRALDAEASVLPRVSVEYIRSMQGNSLENMLRNLSDRAADGQNGAFGEKFITGLTEKVLGAFDMSRYGARPYNGIEELLACLRRKKLKLGVLSNKPDRAAALEAAALFPRFEFDFVRGVITGEPFKPDPASVWNILAELDAGTGSTILVGDSATDMKTALNAECLPVGVSWGYFDAALLKEAGARFIINEPEELLDLL